MTDGSHERVMRTLADVVTHHDWDRLGDAVTDDSVLEFPQSGEVFRGLANVQQATLAAVAPGIAEALVATAIGLFAAIPAVVAYNRYAYDIDRLANRFETFTDEFSNILHRHAR